MKKGEKISRTAKIMIVIAIVVALASALLCIGTGLGIGPFARSNTKNDIPVASGKDGETLKTNVVRITGRSKDGEISGTGFFTKDGYLVTGSSVVDSADEISVIYSDGSSTIVEKAKLVANDIDCNTAILELDESNESESKITDIVQSFELTDSEDMTDSAEGDIAVQVLGYATGENKASAVDAMGTIVEKDDGSNVIGMDTGLDSSYIGSPVIDENGNIVGMVTLANSTLDFSLAGTSETIGEKKEELAESRTVEEPNEGVRSNQYTDVAYDDYGEEITGLYDDSNRIYGETTVTTGVTFSVDQENERLLELKYDAVNATEDVAAAFSKDGESVATVITEFGSYTCPVNEVEIRKGDTGTMLFMFDDLEGIIKRLEISNAYAGEFGTLVLEMDSAAETNATETEETTALDVKTELESDEDFIGVVSDFWISLEYDCTAGESNIIPAIIGHAGRYTYDKYWPSSVYYTNTETQLPGYGIQMPETPLKWYVLNIYNLPEEIYNDFRDEAAQLYTSYNGSYMENALTLYDNETYYQFAAGWGGYYGVICGIISAEKAGNLYYVELYGLDNRANRSLSNYSWGTPLEQIENPLYRYAVMEKKAIDGREYWTIHSINGSGF